MTPFEVKDAPLRQRVKILAGLALALAACFMRPLLDLARLSLHSELFSYILLIPVIIVYLVWLRRDAIPSRWEAAWKATGVAMAAGLALAGAYWWERRAGWKPSPEDYLAIMTSSFLLLLLSLALAVLGGRALRALAFPVALMVFMVPYPTVMLDAVNIFFDQTSAYAACAFFRMAGTPYFNEGLVVHLPGFPLRVAPECSGIHSTLVLLITSLLAGNLFLTSGWRRALLTVFVLPLAIARNGFRIWVIGELCVHVGPSMIDSPIHHHGGPVFFLLSLIPFFLLLVFLRKSEFTTRKDARVRADDLSRAPL